MGLDRVTPFHGSRGPQLTEGCSPESGCDATLPAYFIKARNPDGTVVDGPAPCIVQWNGYSFEDHALWVWGQDSMQDFEKLWDRITLDGVVEQITVPYLITHGVNDRQIPVADAHPSYEQATSSPKRELKLFTAHEGGVEHANSDDQPNAARFTADWVAETFGTRTA